MEVKKMRMLIIILQMFTILGGGLGIGEEIDSKMLPTPSEDSTINFEKMSREELITFILRLQKTTNEPGIISNIGSSGKEIDRRYGSCPPCPLCPSCPPCPSTEQRFNFGDHIRRSTHFEVLDTRKKKPSKKCTKFQKKCLKVCKNVKICENNNKCKKCCANCKEKPSTTPTASPCPSPPICPSLPICPTMPAPSTCATESAVKAITSTLDGCEGDYGYNEEYPGGDEKEVPDGDTCHSVCKNEAGCEAWTWNADDQHCRIHATIGTTRLKTGSVSGLKTACKPKCNSVIGPANGTSSLEFCTSEKSKKSVPVQYLSSPNYPRNYHNNQDTSQKMSVENGAAIRVTFHDFQIEYQSSCRWDYVKFCDGKGICGNKMCSTKPKDFTIRDSKATVLFHSDFMVTRRGFQLSYSAVCTPGAVNSFPCFCEDVTSRSGKVCIGGERCTKDGTCKPDCYQSFNLSNREGKIISSPGFLENENYSNNLECKWILTVPNGEKVSMTILHMNTEYGYDVIRVLDGISEEDDKLPILATMSGEEKPEAVISSSSQMTVTFTSDVNVNLTGFQANVVALKKSDLPQFVWIDLFTLNITYPSGKNEIISLTRRAEDENICIFEGLTLETSVIIISPSSTNECKSLDQFIEIVVRSKFMEDKKRIYTMRNGRLQQIDINVFGNNELVRKKDILLKKRNAEQKIPSKIRIPIQFGFDETLVKKFSKYEHEKSYIQKRLLEIFNGVKLNLKNILHKTDVEFTLEKRIIYINKELKVNAATLMESRKYQLREDIPLVIFCDEDHHSNIKGLTFRSGACRKNKERNGVIMMTWRDDGSLAADVLEHELGHLIGGVHNQKKGTETHVGHTDFNSDNINSWFTLAGVRCYGKNCSSPPDLPHGSWVCDTNLHSCDLICDWGFTTLSSTIQCQNGNWSQNINDMACLPSVFLVAGGEGADVEMFHPEVGNLLCTNKPPALTLHFDSHTTFTHRGELYLCGGSKAGEMCISNNGGNTWSKHSLQQNRWAGLSSVVMGETIFLIGDNYGWFEVEQSRLPLLTATPTWNPVPNMPYKGKYQCSVKVDSKSFLVIGGKKGDLNSPLNTVSKYNMEEETTKALAPLMQSRKGHGCLVLQEHGTTWIIVTGGDSGTTLKMLKSAEILNLSDSKNKWISIGDLNGAREGHGMALTAKGPIVVGGWDKNINRLKSIEVLNWQTKLWMQIGQSLTTARAWFGGVIEIPSNVFNCELNIHTGCPDIPVKENSNWSCDRNKTSCLLICDPGFASAYTTTTCTGGVWKEINKMECTESVLVIAGGYVAYTNVEIFHPEVPNIKCSSPPPSLDLKWHWHTSFTHQGTIYLCGGSNTAGSCTTYSNNHNTWSMHPLQEDRFNGHSSVVLGDKIFLIGGKYHNFKEVEQSRLPFLTDPATWSQVPNMPYKGKFQCSVEIGVNSFVVIGGSYNGVLSKVTRYNIEEETTEALDPLIQPRYRHGCLVKQENGATWIIVTAGTYGTYAHPTTLKSTEILNLSDSRNKWISIGDLNVARRGHGMALTVKGPIVVSGENENANRLKSIEVLNWQTKRWTQFEQSLTTGRSYYGGVIELPAHLFGCETQPITITGCTGEYKYNKEFIGGAATPVNQDQTCHSLCQNNDDCLGWTWTQEKKCRIITQQSALDSLHPKTGSISGVKNACKPKCYLVLSDNEEASTNTQLCTDENTETDCLNMIHLEPDDFESADNGNIKICYHNEDQGRSYCEDVDYENIDLLCNPDPGIVTLSTFDRINKYLYTISNTPYYGYGTK